MSGSVAFNPETNEILVFGKDNAWQPAQRARNNETGQEIYYDGNEWKPLPGTTAPVGAGQAAMFGAMDPVHGGAQALVSNLPSGVVDVVNRATAAVNKMPVIGPMTRAIGMTPRTPEQLNAEVVSRERNFSAGREAAGVKPDDFDWARFGGAIVPSLAVTLATRNPTTMAQALRQGAVIGGGFGAAQPVTDEGRAAENRRIENTVIGGGVGALGGAVGRTLGGLIAPAERPNQTALRAAGVDMTPGMMVGGMAQRMEDKATSIPFLGDAINNARIASNESFVRAVARKVLEPLKRNVDDAPIAQRGIVNAVEGTISKAYDDALARVKPTSPDQEFTAGINKISEQFLTPDSIDVFQRLMRDRVMSRFQGEPLTGRAFKDIDSELGTMVRNFQSSANLPDREVGRAFAQVQSELRQLVARANPDVAPDIRAADAAHARFIRMAEASRSLNSPDGMFTPAQFNNAVRNESYGRQYAGGRALMQDLSDPAKAVLPSTMPNSGSADRALIAALLGGFGGVVDPIAVGAQAALSGAYTPAARELLARVLLSSRPELVRQTGRAVSQSGAGIAVPLGQMMITPPGPELFQ